jgi:hypothetical protein
MNIEVAHKLHERTEDEPKEGRGGRERTLEIVEACLLAFVAIATAWSGYQATRWDGREAELYGMSSRLRITANQEATLGGQQRLYDITTFNAWVGPYLNGNKQLAGVFEARFRPEYRVAFDAWMALDPFHNPDAPPGPVFMPQYRNALLEDAARLDAQASATFERGTLARETGDDYVRITVLLASVLFLAAIAQRFQVVRIRIGLLSVAAVLLAIALLNVFSYPHR